MCIAFLPSVQGCTNRIGNLWGTMLHFSDGGKKIHSSYCYRPLLHGVVYKATSVAFRIIVLRRDLSVGVNKLQIQGGSNMTGTDVARFTHKQSRSYS